MGLGGSVIQMEGQPVRNWKYVHHNRKQSEESFENSIDSVQSSKSGKFNRFQFRKEDHRPPPSNPFRDPKEPIFVFTGKSRERKQERSLLSKNSLPDKDSDTSKLSENELVLKGITSHIHRTDREITPKPERQTPRTAREPKEPKPDDRAEPRQKETPLLKAEAAVGGHGVKEILKQVRDITEQFKRVIRLFSKKYRDIRFEWDRSFKALLALQLNHETQAVRELKAELERKQQELEQLARNTERLPPFPLLPATPTPASAAKPTDSHRPIPNSSFEKLTISKVEPPRETETLSRNNTIADFLNAQAMREQRAAGAEQRVAAGLQVRGLRQAIKRMQQILQQ